MTFRDHHLDIQPLPALDLDRLDHWTQQASNDATDFFRGQSRCHNQDSLVDKILDHLEFPPLFGHHHHHHHEHHHHHAHMHNHRDMHLGASWLESMQSPYGRPEGPIADRTYEPSKPVEHAPCPPGFDQTKWNNGHDTPKYFIGHMVADWLQEDMKNFPREGQEQRCEEFLKSQVPVLEARGYHVQKVENEKMLIDVNGKGATWADVIVDVGGKNPHAAWQV
ncbi:MAG: hypothetical protein JST01_23350 [Cyanobacteria bacterium SZAS TMP-1]|nr:hypothetical protein [Cyanobacteria bacterium SZAS TMP-1]